MSIWRRWFPWAFEPEVSVRLESSEPPEPRSTFDERDSDGRRLYARRGEQITCEYGHPIAQVTRDIKRGNIQGEHDLYFNGETAKPAMGTPIEQCRCHLCNGLWVVSNGHFHFKDGYR